MAKAKKLVNHVIFVIDGSGSMNYHMNTVRRVFDETVQNIKVNQAKDQENNISVYQFDNRIETLAMNVPVDALSTPQFWSRGMTALRDATLKAVNDHKKFETIKGEDHTFLVYVITDGEDNASSVSSSHLKHELDALSDSFTFIAMVPNLQGVHAAKVAGIPAGNIQVWDVGSEKGFESVGATINASYQTYSTMRSQGVRSSSSIFQPNLSSVTKTDLKAAGVDKVQGNLFHAQKDYVIKDMVEKCTGLPYVKGSTFYELSKLELVQGYKEIVIVHTGSDLNRYGGDEARSVLGISNVDMKIKPGQHGQWRIFVQSTSLNRKIPAGTSIFVKS